ncbi:MAG: hypothetical protein ACAH59_04205 [Pseudobdellovibrionaceae bacterium]
MPNAPYAFLTPSIVRMSFAGEDFGESQMAGGLPGFTANHAMQAFLKPLLTLAFGKTNDIKMKSSESSSALVSHKEGLLKY